LLVPVIVSGTFSAPKFRPDLEALAKANLGVDKKELEAKGKEALDQKANEVLGDQSETVKGLLGQGNKSEPDTGAETGSEGAKEKPEDKAKGLIKGLLKGN
jgi:hypothetical protein